MKGRKKSISEAASRRQIGLVCKLIHQHFRRQFEWNAAKAGLDDVTLSHGRILGFLSHSDTPVFQRDIEAAFGINRSTVTGIMQLMEKNGLIERKSVPQDSRLKQVCITENGRSLHRKIMAVIETSEQQILEGLTADEISAFFSVALKIEKTVSEKTGGTVC